jgi:membrane-bound metal-dependent hydrolase YbcI (DUF457 family)
MFIGHFGAAFAAKKVVKRPSLGTLFMAAQFVDLLWTLFLLLGIESVKIEPGNTAVTPLNFINYPFTHSLFGVLVWGVLFGFIYFLIKKDKKTSVVLGLLVLSHWILDLLVHRPDLPVIPGVDLKVGLGLWNSVSLTIILESIIFFGGVYLYSVLTKARNKKGVYSFLGLIVFLALVYVANLFGSPPPSEEAIGYVGLSQWLIVAWGYWIDRNRVSVLS